MKNQKGFTLIELLLVLAIIGIIAAIAIPALLGERQRARIKAVESMVANVQAECVRINDALKDGTSTATTTITAGSVVKKVLALSNYKAPAAKNPYTPGDKTPYVSAAGALGQVQLSAMESYTDTATGYVGKAILITGKFTPTKTGAASTVTKVVALD